MTNGWQDLRSQVAVPIPPSAQVPCRLPWPSLAVSQAATGSACSGGAQRV